MSLQIATGFDLPLDAATQTFAILAIKRAGKSNAAVVMAEEMYDNGIPWVAIDPKGDWWGVRAAGGGKDPGLAVLVFGGLHGDVPLEPTSGALVADLVVDQRVTCVLDVSEMNKADQRRFLTAFASRLYKANREPLHVFCEEADEYIPQRVMANNAAMVGSFETLVKRGGFRGIGITLVTQRSASLNKDVLTQIETLIPMRTPSPQDRKAILAWVDYHAAGKELVDQLPTLANGEAYIFSPQWLRTLTKIKFRRRRTFDSGATPKVGSKPRPPTTLAEVNLDAIKAAMAETIDRVEAENPKVLRKRIAELERQIASQPTPEPKQIEVSVFSDSDRAMLVSASEMLVRVEHELAEVKSPLGDLSARLLDTPQVPMARPRQVSGPSSSSTRPAVAQKITSRPVTTPSGEGVKLVKAERSILTVLAQYGALDKDAVGLRSGYSVKGGGFNNALGSLRTKEFISPARSGSIEITQEGLAALGEFEELPTGWELAEHHLRSLGKAHRMIMEALWTASEPMSKEEIASATDYAPNGGGFNNALGRLRSLELVVTEGGLSRVSDNLLED